MRPHERVRAGSPSRALAIVSKKGSAQRVTLHTFSSGNVGDVLLCFLPPPHANALFLPFLRNFGVNSAIMLRGEAAVLSLFLVALSLGAAWSTGVSDSILKEIQDHRQVCWIVLVFCDLSELIT